MNSAKLQDTKTTQKLVAFLHTNTQQSEKEIKKISFTLASKRINYLEINLTKEKKRLPHQKLKMLLKEIKNIQINEKT